VKYVLIALFLIMTPTCCLAQAGAPAAAPSHPHGAPTQADRQGLFARAVVAVIDQQRQFHRRLAASLEAVRSEGAAAAGWTLIVTSFLYGIFHAVGPGHGKAVLTAYLATHREKFRRGILLAAAASAVQGLVAILLVFGLTWMAGWAARDTQSAVRWAEQLSFALVAVLGGYLAWRAGNALRRTLVRSASPRHKHGHSHVHGHAPGVCDHDHCSHAHFPTPDRLDNTPDLKAMAGVVLSVGIRPCSGAVLMLAVANLFAIPWMGVAAVFAMSVGTALAVATLALLVLSARRLAAALIVSDSRGVALAGRILALAGGLLIFAVGATLLIGSSGPAHPLGL
jgi:ABC-type nickel/cobalt efflux system permease component RcnA